MTKPPELTPEQEAKLKDILNDGTVRHVWGKVKQAYEWGYADCAAQGAKDREELANALAMALNILGHPDDAVTIALWKIHDKARKDTK